jgi:hypothetical protein
VDLPIACTLSEAALIERRRAIMDMFQRMQCTVSELPAGYAFTFTGTADALAHITTLVDMERECCPFLTFKIVVEAAKEIVRLEVTGPKEAKTVIADFFKCGEVAP